MWTGSIFKETHALYTPRIPHDPDGPHACNIRRISWMYHSRFGLIEGELKRLTAVSSVAFMLVSVVSVEYLTCPCLITDVRIPDSVGGNHALC